MATTTLADRLFESWRTWENLENEFNDAIGKIVSNKKYGELIFDDHDISMEFKDCKDDFNVTASEELEIYKLGFSHFWVCYKNGKQKYYNARRPRDA